MEAFFTALFGLDATAQTITTSQTCARTALVFLVALLLLRVSGRRTFSSNSALDMLVKFMLGAILSRSITGDAPMGSTFAAATTLILLHRALAYATFFFPAFHRFVKGEGSILAEGNAVRAHELRRASISEDDMRVGVRAAANLDDLSETKTVRLEHDGSITVVKK